MVLYQRSILILTVLSTALVKVNADMGLNEKGLDLSGTGTFKQSTPVAREKKKRDVRRQFGFMHLLSNEWFGDLKSNERSRCTVWNGNYFRTKEGDIFASYCGMKLVQGPSGNLTINTHVHNNGWYLKVKYRDKSYEFRYRGEMNQIEIYDEKNNNVLKVHKVPYESKDISVREKAAFVHVNLKGTGITITFSGYSRVSVEMNSTVWKAMSGLCNDNSLRSNNDPYSRRLSVWEADGNSHYDCEINLDNSEKKDDICNDIFDHFQLKYCQKLQGYDKYRAACYGENQVDAKYQTLQIYIEDCKNSAKKNNPTLNLTYHSNEINKHLCPPGKIYSDCGPLMEPTCQTLQLQTPDSGCTEGCFCPDVLQEGKCIRREECTCLWRRKVYKNGAKVHRDCNTCTCTYGAWSCTDRRCGARCSVVAGSHYLTFDGMRYDLGGSCSRYLLKTDNYAIEYGKLACFEHLFDSAGNFYGNLSCPKSLRIWLKNDVITLKRPNRILVNGLDVHGLPMHVSDATITSASSLYVAVKLANSVEVWWSEHNVYIDLPYGHEDPTRGLCGTYSNNIKDDFLTPEGDIEENAAVFGDKWKTDEMCNEDVGLSSLDPCDWDPEKKTEATTSCQALLSSPFSACHFHVDVNPFYDLCIREVCLCQSAPTSCFCPILAAYGVQCSRQKVTLDWRKITRQCDLNCPSGQTYQACGNSCTRTCEHVAMKECKTSCVEGCNCPPGKTLNSTGECIPIGDCPCFYEHEKFSAGHTLVMHSHEGPQFCRCQEAKWVCRPVSTTIVPRGWYENRQIECNETLNEEFTNCKPTKTETCKNKHATLSRNNGVCFPGCVCKKGFVWEPVSKRCVNATQCPCQHSGKTYATGEQISAGCNSCTCTNGVWSCTDNVCSSVCSMWAGSHVKTFDGKFYDFSGSCEYLMVYGSLANNDTFLVTVQVLPYEPNDRTYLAVTIHVKMNNYTAKVELENSRKSDSWDDLNGISVKDVDSSILAEVMDLGLAIQWDKKSSVTVRVDPRWKNKVKGLCGDFNGYEMDDVNAYGEAANDVLLFLDSWRFQNSCPKSESLINSCKSGPRREEALEKCSALKSTIFQSCHSEVSFQPYLERCVIDVCYGKNDTQYQPECSAFAAYATQCAHWGIPIEWRNSTFCPICLNSHFEYMPCISTKTCPTSTCQNHNKNNAEMCSEEMCFEGCGKPACPPQHVFKDEQSTDCINLTECENFCLTENNTMYWEGDVMEEGDCYKCFCFQHKKKCFENPCNETHDNIESDEESLQLRNINSGALNVAEKISDFCLYEYEVGDNSEHLGTEHQNETHKQVGDNWLDGPCKSCSCIVKNGNAQVVCSTIQCPSLRQHPDYHEYELLQVFYQDKCCPQIVRKRCKHLGQIFEVNDSWLQNYSQPCETMKCADLGNGLIGKEFHRQVCNNHCNQGWAYTRKESECCGRCVPIGCATEDKIFEDGDVWLSEDGCTRNTCFRTQNGQFFVSSIKEKCPSIKDCSEDNIYKDGCCSKCRSQTEGNEMCSVEAVPQNSTLGIIRLEHDDYRGNCVNQEYLENYARCSGNCHSTSEFANLEEKKDCKCCSVTDWRSENVILICDDNEPYEHEIRIPTACSCRPCNE